METFAPEPYIFIWQTYGIDEVRTNFIETTYPLEVVQKACTLCNGAHEDGEMLAQIEPNMLLAKTPRPRSLETYLYDHIWTERAECALIHSGLPVALVTAVRALVAERNSKLLP
jgi:hypothetical protein